MVIVFFVQGNGVLDQLHLDLGSSSSQLFTLEALKGIFMERTQFCSAEFSWFRNTLPLGIEECIEDGDRIVAIRKARLSPSSWRAQRVARATHK